MKNWLCKTLVILSLISGQAFADEIDELFGGKDPNNEFRFSEENIMTAISHDAALVYKDGLFTLTSTNSRYKEFTINVNGGLGNNANMGYGGYGSGTGTYINLNQNTPSVSFMDRIHFGVNLQVRIGSCVKSVNIPRSLYYAINRYMYGLLNEDGTPRKAFTPADEAMIMFYTTIMKLADGCSSGGGR